MGVEVVGFETVQGPVDAFPVEDNSALHEKENGKLDQVPGLGLDEPIKFGSHGDEPAKEEAKDVSINDVPKNAVDEWPAPKQIHSFYFIRCRPYDDPNIKAKMDLVDKDIQKKNQTRSQITEALRAKRSDRAGLISQIKALKDDNRQFRTIMDEKIREIEPLQQALGKLRSTYNGGRAGGLCNSEEELNAIIEGLQYRIQHESIPLSEEKQIVREIKQLEGTREKVVANAAMRTKLQDSMGQKETIQDQVKLIGGDLDGVRKEQQAVRGKIKQLDDALKVIDQDIKSYQDELTAVMEKRDQSYESIQQLRKKRDDGNSYFYRSRTVVNKARELAAKKDVKGLEDLSHAEVEKFNSLWNSEKAFRDDYGKRILPSLDGRQLSRDGRMRNPDEKPLVMVREPTPSATVEIPKANAKRPVENSKPLPVEEGPPAAKPQKEGTSKVVEPKPAAELNNKADEDIPVFEKPEKEAPKEKDIDPAKLKEMKREEEIAKAKLAMERKKKLQEKAVAKAAIRAQKEAQEREKKAKKKASASATDATCPEEDAVDAVEETSVPEKANETVEAPVPAKEKAQKETTTIRSRSSKAKGPDGIPKAILRRKKSTNYWIWAVPAALVLLILVVLAANDYLF